MSHPLLVEVTPLPKKKPRYRLLRLGLSLATLHITVVAQLVPVIGFGAILYAVFPPFIFFIAYDSAVLCPLFALIALGTSLVVWLGLRNALWPGISGFPRLAKWLVIAAMAIWIPLACGEAIRWALMETRIVNAAPDCYRTSTLTASLRERYSMGDWREPHAWMIRNDQPWLWSYRSLRFEPAPDWLSAPPSSKDCTVRSKTGVDR